jgi:MFS family permease
MMRTLTPNFTGRGFLVPFEVVSFRWAWGGLVCSVFSDQAQAALLAVVALNLVGSASGWAAILTAQAVPRILLIVVGGVVADRVPLQAILRVGNALQALALVSIAALDHIGILTVPDLYAFAIIYGALAAFTAPATDSLMPSLLPPDLMRRGNALRSLALNVGRFLGPPAVTTLLVVAGAEVALVGVAVLCAAAALAFGQVTAGRRQQRAAEPLFDQARAGLTVAASQPLVGVPILMLVIFNVGYSGATYVGLPALARLELGAGAQGVGLLLGSLGAGALVGAVTMLLISSIPRVGWFACLAIATVGLGLVGAGMAHSLWTVATCLAVAGLGISCAAVALLTIVQVHAPVETRGRVLALWSLAFTGLTPLSYALAGLVGERLGAHGIILLGGVCVLGAAGFGLLSRPMRQLA